jgi:chromosome segregation ATPase
MELHQAINEAEKFLRGIQGVKGVIEAFKGANALTSLVAERQAHLAAQDKLMADKAREIAGLLAEFDNLALDYDAAQLTELHRKQAKEAEFAQLKRDFDTKYEAVRMAAEHELDILKVDREILSETLEKLQVEIVDTTKRLDAAKAQIKSLLGGANA